MRMNSERPQTCQCWPILKDDTWIVHLCVPEILHALSQPLQQELDVLRDVLVVVLLLLQVLQLLQDFTLNHGQSVLLPGLPLCRLLQKILETVKTRRLMLNTLLTLLSCSGSKCLIQKFKNIKTLKDFSHFETSAWFIYCNWCIK